MVEVIFAQVLNLFCWALFLKYVYCSRSKQLIILMITETNQENNSPSLYTASSHRLLKIVRQTNEQLVLTDGLSHMIFKTYSLDDQQSLEILQFRTTLHHQGLIKIHKVQVQKHISKEQYPLHCGVLFEKYEKTLERTARQMAVFTHEEVYQTLHPIRQVIDHLIMHNYDPGAIKSDSIVCTQNYQIKFIDRFLHEGKVDMPSRENFRTQVYEDFTAMAFHLFFPRQKHIKAWRCRYEIAQKSLSHQHFKFIQDLYLKFAPNFVSTEKSKKIKKSEMQIQKNLECKRSKRIKDKLTKRNALDENINRQEGKQNKQRQ